MKLHKIIWQTVWYYTYIYMLLYLYRLKWRFLVYMFYWCILFNCWYNVCIYPYHICCIFILNIAKIYVGVILFLQAINTIEKYISLYNIILYIDILISDYIKLNDLFEFFYKFSCFYESGKFLLIFSIIFCEFYASLYVQYKFIKLKKDNQRTYLFVYIALS